jgi:enoyl-CoA hydratase/carnithine racemase
MSIENNQVKWEVFESIGILSIDAPPENRIVNPEFISLELLNEWTSDPNLRGIVITGTGRHFSSGADLEGLRNLAKMPMVMLTQMQKGSELLNFIQDIQLPVIAAISGVCFGAGLEIALSCHVRVCTKNSLFAFPESALGIMPGLGGTARLLKLAGVEASMQLLFSGDAIDAEKAKGWGIVDYVVPNKQAKEYSLDYLKKLVADRPIDVIHSIVQAINNARSLPVSEALKRESMMFCDLAVKKFGKG